MNNEDTKIDVLNKLNRNDIDDEKLKRIVKKIITLENDNVKTRELNDEDMKKKIAKIIEEEIKCC